MSIERPVPGVTVIDQPEEKRKHLETNIGDTESFPSQKHGATPKAEPPHHVGTESTATAHEVNREPISEDKTIQNIDKQGEFGEL